MARPIKQGLEYFSFDTDFFSDVKIRKISRACGVSSTSILICLLCNIYRDKGYYILWDEDLPFVIADTVGVSEGAVKEVILKALQVGFFNQTLYEKYKILTSNGIQNRFKSAVVRREEIEYIVEYLVSDDKNIINVCNNPVNDDGSTQSKVKVKRKKRESKAVIPPTPPKGGRRKKESEPKEINLKARSLFEAHYKAVFLSDYYWTAKDAGAMSQLLQKLKFQREQRKMDVLDGSILHALDYLLSSIKEGWLLEHFSVTNINSQFNEIISQARNGKSISTTKSTNSSSTANERKESVEGLANLAEGVLQGIGAEKFK